MEVNSALAIVTAGELVRTNTDPKSALWKEWHVARLESLHELAFLRAFVAWEIFLQESLCRYMCGYNSANFGQAVPVGTYHSTLTLAVAAIHGQHQYVLWHDPTKVANRCAMHLNGSRNEIIVRGSIGRLSAFSYIRNRIAHGQDDAKWKFDNATMTLAHRHYRASRPGRFLRDRTLIGGAQVRWLNVILNELVGMASQIV